MNKKGFTLTELLVVIVILGIIAMITVPIINNAIADSRKKTYEEQERSIVNAAKLYMANYSTELPAENKCISVEDLKEKGLLKYKDIKNPLYNRTSSNPIEKDKNFDGAVSVNRNGSKYEYTYVDKSDCS